MAGGGEGNRTGAEFSELGLRYHRGKYFAREFWPIRKNSEGTHEALRKAAFQFKEVGEISGIIQVGPSQYVVLKYEGRTEPVSHSVEDVQAQLHAELEEREVQKMVGETFEGLQKSARVDNFLTGESRGGLEKASQATVGKEAARR